jgi:Stress responsive A/B Barrel Domain
MKMLSYLLSLFCFTVLLPGPAKAQSDTVKNGQIRHVEIVTFQPGTSDSSKHMVDKSYRQAADAFPVVKAFEWGWDQNDKTQNKRIYVTTFNSKGELTTYNASPQHQAVTKTKSIKNITTIDYPVNK